jgi:hypothetical protein
VGRISELICTLLLYDATAVAAQSTDPPVSLSQSLLLSIAVILLFAVQVYTTAFTARKVRVFDVSYGRALWATVLVNVSSILIQGVLVELLGLSQLLAVLVLIAVPVFIFKLVFTSTVRQAALIWVAVLAVGVLAAIALVAVALSLGSWLDTRFDLPTTPTLSYVPTLEGASSCAPS